MWELIHREQWRNHAWLVGVMYLSQQASKRLAHKTPPTRLGPPGFPSAKLKNTRSGGAWAMELEDIWLLWALFPPVAKAACVTRQQGPGKRTQDKIPWSQHFSFTFMVYVFCVCERECVYRETICAYTCHKCVEIKEKCGGTNTLFHIGSGDWTQVIGHSTLLEWAELYFLWVNNF